MNMKEQIGVQLHLILKPVLFDYVGHFIHNILFNDYLITHYVLRMVRGGCCLDLLRK